MMICHSFPQVCDFVNMLVVLQNISMQLSKVPIRNFLRSYRQERLQLIRRCLAYVGQWMNLDD